MKRATRKLVSLILALSMLFSLLPATALADAMAELLPSIGTEEIDPGFSVDPTEPPVDPTTPPTEEPAPPVEEPGVEQDAKAGEPSVEQQATLDGPFTPALDATGHPTGTYSIKGVDGGREFVIAIVASFDYMYKSSSTPIQDDYILELDKTNTHPTVVDDFVSSEAQIFPILLYKFKIENSTTNMVHIFDISEQFDGLSISTQDIENRFDGVNVRPMADGYPDGYQYTVYLGSNAGLYANSDTYVSLSSSITAGNITGTVGTDDFISYVQCDNKTIPATITGIELGPKLTAKGITGVTGLTVGQTLTYADPAVEMVLDTTNVKRTAEDVTFYDDITIKYNGADKIVKVKITIPGAAQLAISPTLITGTEQNSSATITLTNTGKTAAAIEKIEVKADAGSNGNVDKGVIPISVAPNGGTVSFALTWTDVVTASGVVVVTYSGGLNATNTVSASYSLSASTNVLSATPIPLECTDTTTAEPLTLTSENNTSSVTTANRITIVANEITASPGFSISGNDTNITLYGKLTAADKQKSAQIGVTADGTKESGSITVKYHQGPAAGTAVTITIPVTYSDVVTPTPALTASPATLTWTGTTGTAITDTKTTKISNVGDANATIADISFTGDFTGSSCTGIAGNDVIAPMGDKDVVITPPDGLTDTKGSKRGAMVITYDDDATVTVTLTATITTTHAVNAKAAPSSDGFVSLDGTVPAASTASASVTDGGSVTFKAAPADAGTHKFINWTNDDAADAEVSANATYATTVSGPLNYTANFKPIYTVSFDTHGGGTVADLTGKLDTDAIALPSPGAKTGYTFAGWFDAATDGDRLGNAGDTITLAGKSLTPANPGGTVTLHAQWTEDTYSISGTITKNGGPWKDATVTYGSKSATTGADGAYTINGVTSGTATLAVTQAATWGGESVQVTSSDATGKNYTFYEVEVKPGAHGNVTGSGATTKNTFKSGTAITLAKAADNGYEFKDWSISSGFTAPLPAATSFTVPSTGTGAITITANFIASAVTLADAAGTGIYGNGTITISLPKAATTGFAADTFTYAVETAADTFGNTLTKNGVTLTGGSTLTIAGKPTIAGEISFTVKATSDTNQNSDTATIKVTAAKAVPTLTATVGAGPYYKDGSSADAFTEVVIAGPYYAGDVAANYNDANWKTLDAKKSDATAEDVGTLTYTPAKLGGSDTSVKVSVTYSGSTTVGNQTYASIWSVPSDTETVPVTASYSVEVSAFLDGTASTDRGVVTLAGVAVAGTVVGNKTTFANVPNGTHGISVGGQPTGKTVEVKGADATAGLYYTTIQYGTPTNGSGTIDTSTNDVIILPGGTKNSVALTATGIGNYEPDTWTGGGSNGTLASDKLTWTINAGYTGGAITLTPTFKATGVDATVTLTVDGDPYASSGKTVKLYQAGTEKYSAAVNGTSGKASFTNITKGSYDVYVDNAPVTGVTLAATAANANATVEYFIVRYTSPATVSPISGSSITPPAPPAMTGSAANNAVVLKGTTVTLTVADWSNAEFTLDFANATAKDIANRQATKTYNAKDTTPVTATLTQKGYEIKGTIDDPARITKVTLVDTAGSKEEFTGTLSSGTYTFANIPKGSYTITVTLKAETQLDTAHAGYSKPDPLAVTVTNAAAFALYSKGNSYHITLNGGADDTDVGETGTDVFSTAPTAKTVTVASTGNSTVTGLSYTKGGAQSGSFDLNTTGTADSLAAGSDTSFTLTPKANLDAGTYVGTVTVASAKLARSVVYTYTYTVTAKDLTAVTISGTAKDGEKLSRASVSTADGAIAAPDAAKTLTYQWQVCATDSADSADWASATGKGNDSKEYTVSAADAGKFLRLAVTGSGNYAETVYSDAVGPAGYTATVTVKQDNVLTDGYTLHLRETGNTSGTKIPLNQNGSTTGSYITGTGALDGATAYDILAQAVKGDDDTITKVGEVSAAVPTGALEYFTVNFNNATQLDNHSKNPTSVMLDAPVANGVSATVKTSANNIADGKLISATGTPVLKNTVVTFDKTTATTGAWKDKDYKLVWAVGTTSDTGIAIDGATAKDMTYDDVTDVVKGTLDLQLYTFTVHFKAGALASLALTDKDAKAQNSQTATPAAAAATHAFAGVPAGKYTLAPTGATGITVLGFTDTGATDTATVPGTTYENIAVSADIVKGVVTEASTYTVKLQHNVSAITPGTDEFTDNVAYTYSGLNYGYSATQPVTVKIVNTGNTTLTGLTLTPSGADIGKFTVSTLNADTVTKGDGVTFTIKPNTTLNAGTYVIPVVVSATETLTTAAADRTYTLTFVVGKAPITLATLDGLAQPVTGMGLTANANVAGIAPANSFDAAAVSWSGGATPTAAAGTVYTASVTLTPGSNYEFVAANLANYTLNTTGVTDKVEDDGTIILTYTFLPTAPEALTISAEGTDWDKGKLSLSTTGSKLKYYYVVSTDGTLTLTGDAIKAAVEGAGTVGQVKDQVAFGSGGSAFVKEEIDNLNPFTDYCIYAVARVDTGNNAAADGAWTATAKAGFETFHKVTVMVDDPTHGDIAAPAGATDGSVVKGVEDGKTLTITATKNATDAKPWAFKTWTVSKDGGTIPADGLTSNSATYTADGTAAEVTLTATYEEAYKVTFDAQGGGATPAVDNKFYVAGGTVAPAAYGGSKQGFTFAGWSVSAKAAAGTASVDIANLLDAYSTATGGDAPAGTALTLYAAWAPAGILASVETPPGVGTYGQTPDYRYANWFTVTYDDAAKTPIASGLTFAVKSGALPRGLSLTAATGAISGRPSEVVTDKAVTITITDTATGSTADVDLKFTVGKATPALSLKYGPAVAETYYVGDPLDAAKLTTSGNASTATAPYWDPTLNSNAGDWVETKAVTGAFSFPANSVFTGINDSYDATHTPESTGTGYDNAGVPGSASALYLPKTAGITIPATAKSYGIKIVDGATGSDELTSATLDTKVYQDYAGDLPSLTFKLKNIGNQPSAIAAADYVLSGTDKGIFTVTNHVAGVPGESTSATAFTVAVNNANLTVKTSYTAKLTITDGHGETAVLNLSFAVTPATIAGAAISGLGVPAKGDEATLLAGLSGDMGTADGAGNVPYAIQSLTWGPNDATFKPGTAYTATVILKADSNYMFAANNPDVPNYTIATDTGATVKVTAVTTAGGTVKYEVAFPATEPGTLTVAAGATNATTGSITSISVPTAVSTDFWWVLTTTQGTYTAAAIAGAANGGTPIADQVAKGSRINRAPSGGTATAGNAIPLSGLAAGTAYYVYAVAENSSGTKTYSNVGEASFTTWYNVTVKVAGASTGMGSVNPIPTTVTAVKPGEKLDITAAAAAAHKFTGWALNTGSGKFDDNTTGGVTSTTNPTVFFPAANTTIEASFKAIPMLQVDGVARGSEAPSDYVPANVEVFNGTVANIGAANMTGSLSYKIVEKGQPMGGTPNDQFVVATLASTPLEVSASTPLMVNPAAGLAPGATYEATIWFYEAGQPDTVPVKLDVEITIVAAGQPVVKPVSLDWNLKAGSTHSDWNDIRVTEKGYHTVTSITLVGGAALTPGTDYSYADADTVGDGKGTLTIKESYLSALAGGKKAGDTAQLSLVLRHPDSGDATPKTLTINYVDATPTLNKVVIAPAKDLKTGSVLTATPTVSTGVPQAGQITYVWYSTDTNAIPANPATGTQLQAGNSATYTLTAADSGKYFYAVAKGDGINYRGEAVSNLTELGQFTITVAADPTAGGAPAASAATVSKGDSAGLTANTKDGYLLTGWTVSTASGSADGGFGTAAPGSPTSQDTNPVFWPVYDATVTASFDLLPLLSILPASYDNGPAAVSPVLPVLTFAENNGELKEIRIKGDDDGSTVDRVLSATDYTFAATTGASGTYTLTKTLLDSLAAGAYAISFVDNNTNAAYTKSVTLTITTTKKGLPNYSIKDNADQTKAPFWTTGEVVIALPASGTPTATYQWYYSADGSLSTVGDVEDAAKATAIAGATGQTLELTNALLTTLNGNHLYVVATGTGDYVGDAKRAVAGPVAFKLTVTAASGGNGTAKVNGTTSATTTLGSTVNLTAAPAAGYKFAGWTGGTGTFGSASDASTTFAPTADSTVTASFAAGTLTADDVTGQVTYGTEAFTPGKTPVLTPVTDAPGETGFSYALAVKGNLYKGTGLTQAQIEAMPSWLAVSSTGTFTVSSKVGTAVVADAADEAVAYVKITDTRTEASVVAKVTVDVIPLGLSITAESYAAAPKHTVGDAVDLARFLATVAEDTTSSPVTLEDAVAGSAAANGTWSVSPATIGGISGSYKFTYAPTSPNYMAANVSVTIAADPSNFSLGVKDDGTPEQVDFATAQTRTGSQDYDVAATTYTVSVKNTGNQPLHNLAVAVTGANEDDFTVTDGGVTGSLNGQDVHDEDIAVVLKDAAKTVGPHTVTIAVTGNTVAGGGAGNTVVTATYTLTVTVNSVKYAVTANSKDESANPGTDTPVYYGDVQVTPDGTKGSTSTGNAPIPSPGYVTVTATPDATHVFEKWVITSGAGTFGTATAAGTATESTDPTAYFWPTATDAVLEASFKVAPSDSLTVLDNSVPPDAEEAFGSVTFGDTVIGKVVTITNNGNTTLTNVKVTPAGDSGKFTVSNDTAKLFTEGVTLAPNATAAFTVTPKTDAVGGEWKATYNVTSSGGDAAKGTYTATVSVEPKVLSDIQVTIPDPAPNKDFPGADKVVVKDKDGVNVDAVTDVEVKWEEKKPDGSWGEPTTAQPQPGKEYRPVVVVKPDSNHKLDNTIDNETINGDKTTENGARIEKDGENDKFTGAPTKLAPIPGVAVLKFQHNEEPSSTSVNKTIRVETGATFGSHTITLSNTVDTVNDVTFVLDGQLKSLLKPVPNTIASMGAGESKEYILDLSTLDNSVARNDSVIIKATGKALNGAYVEATYTFSLQVTVPAPPNPDGGGGGGTAAKKFAVKYSIDKAMGTTKDKVSEQVEEGAKPANVPAITVKDGYVFLGWTLDPKAADIALVKPEDKAITEDTTFYAVFSTGYNHERYIKGYDTGIFAPADNISRSQVAAIIARACLEGFNENNDYGNGGYSDVAGDHWARSAIAFCSKAGVFVGVGEGRFEPDRPITRQEFSLVFARMAGLLSADEMPFTDASATADWAMDGVYTAFAKGWLDGYADGTFKPWNNIARSEAVKIVNRYLNRGTDKAGLEKVYSDLKQWPDVPESYWAYYDIIEASNDHTYLYADGKMPPESWSKASIMKTHWGD